MGGEGRIAEKGGEKERRARKKDEYCIYIFAGAQTRGSSLIYVIFLAVSLMTFSMIFRH